MDNIQDYLESGILEMYVYGALSEAESAEVSRKLKEYPELRREVEQIEEALLEVSGAAAPYEPEVLLQSLKNKLKTRRRVRTKSHWNWRSISGWAASLILLIGLFAMYQKNNDLEEKLITFEKEQTELQNKIIEAREDAEKAEELLEMLRSRQIERVLLPGQKFAPEAYATAYWNKEEDVTYLDAQDLPEPPSGMVYQVWSLKLNPLTPVSIGLLDDFEENEQKIFVVENSYDSEAFGITLEPAGGSESPTLDRLVVLGTVTNT